MLNFFTRQLSKKNKKGFTLIELIVVIAIVAILAGIGIPAIAGQVNRARQSSVEADAKVIATAGSVLISEHETAGTWVAGTTPSDADILARAGVAAAGVTITRTAVTDPVSGVTISERLSVTVVRNGRTGTFG